MSSIVWLKLNEVVLLMSKEFEQTFQNSAQHATTCLDISNIFNNFIPDSQGFPSKSGPPDHEIGEDGDPYDAHQEGNRVVSLPVLVLGVRDAAPHGDHQGQGEGPHDLSHDGVAGPATDIVHVRLLSFLLCALLLLHLQRLLRFILLPVLSVESITILGLDESEFDEILRFQSCSENNHLLFTCSWILRPSSPTPGV